MKLSKIWSKIRPVEKRFYRYGTIGLNICDDRTWLEKVCDCIDDKISRSESKSPTRDTSRWHTYFDVSTGKYIMSMEDIRKIEKEKGWTYMDFKDIEKENKIQTKAIERKFRDNTKGYLRTAIKEIKQGKSYVRDIHEKIKKNEYEIGQRRAANA